MNELKFLSFRDRRGTAWWIAGLAIFLAVALFFIARERTIRQYPHHVADATLYIYLAHNLAVHKTFTPTGGPAEIEEAMRRLPAYPALLSLLIGKETRREIFRYGSDGWFKAYILTLRQTSWIMLAHCLLALGTASMIFLLIKKLTGSPLASFVAVFLYAFDLPTQRMLVTIGYETFFTFLIMLGLFICVWEFKSSKIEKCKYFLSGLVLSLSALTRSNGLYLVLPVIAFFLIQGRQWGYKRSLVISGIWLTGFLMLLPIRFITTASWIGTPVYYSGQGKYIYYWRIPAILSELDGQTFQVHQKILEKKYLKKREELGRMGVEDWSRKESFKILLSHPWISAKVLMSAWFHLLTAAGRSTIGTYFYDKEPSMFVSYKLVKQPWLILKDLSVKTLFKFASDSMIYFLMYMWGHLAVVYTLAITGGVKTCRKRPEILLLFILVYGYLIMSSVATETSARLRVPFMPGILLFAGLGFYHLMKKFGFEIAEEG